MQNLIFRQLFEPVSSTYTYLLADPETRRAVLIDPVVEDVEKYVELLSELELELVYTIETHVHADHVTGGGALRDRLGSKTVVHKDGGAPCADMLISDGVRIQVDSVVLTALHTPGHTNGDVCYYAGDRVFTGDTLLIGGCGRTDFQAGNSSSLYHSVHEKLFTLPPDTLVYPAHDYKGDRVSTIAQEMDKNARLGGGKSEAEFVEIMANLKLSYPKQIDRAVPANQACGREQSEVQG